MISKFSQHFYHLFGLFLLFFNLNSWAVDYPKAPDPFYYVNDYTNTLNPQEWRTLENALIENRNKTSSQIIVAIIPTTQGEEIAQYATNLFNKWGIGRTKHNENNGVLLLVAKMTVNSLSQQDEVLKGHCLMQQLQPLSAITSRLISNKSVMRKVLPTAYRQLWQLLTVNMLLTTAIVKNNNRSMTLEGYSFS